MQFHRPTHQFYRTCKQHLGLNASRSQEAKVYINHIKCVFVAYTILQFIMKKFRLDSVEDAIIKAQALKEKHGFDGLIDRISLLTVYA